MLNFSIRDSNTKRYSVGQTEDLNEKRKIWVKIFHHNIVTGYFKSLAEAESSTEKGKFSALSTLSDSMKVDGQFEFRLEYPQDGLVYQWKQTTNPVRILNEKLSPSEYSQVLSPPQPGGWRGYLAKSTATSCSYLDGYDRGFWWFSIGTVYSSSDSFFDDFPGKLPGPCLTGVNEVVLWVRVPEAETARCIQSFKLFIVLSFIS